MNPDPSFPPPEGCEACQQLISEFADLGAPLTPALQAHLQTCAECQRFAEVWFPEPPAALRRPVPAVDDERLRERILRAAAEPEIIPFPATAARHVNWTAWSRRAAACLVFAGLAYWLLNPQPSPVRKPGVVAIQPTLGQSLAKAEDDTKREQQVLQTALVDGGQRVHRDVAWTMSALEL